MTDVWFDDSWFQVIQPNTDQPDQEVVCLQKVIIDMKSNQPLKQIRVSNSYLFTHNAKVK